MSRLGNMFGFPAGSRKPLSYSFAILLVHSLVVSISFFLLQPEIPLWYSLAEKSQQLAPKAWIFVIPVTSGLWFFITAALARAASKLDTSLVKLFSWIHVGLQVIWLIVSLRIVFITW